MASYEMGMFWDAGYAQPLPKGKWPAAGAPLQETAIRPNLLKPSVGSGYGGSNTRNERVKLRGTGPLNKGSGHCSVQWEGVAGSPTGVALSEVRLRKPAAMKRVGNTIPESGHIADQLNSLLMVVLWFSLPEGVGRCAERDSSVGPFSFPA